MTKNCGAIKKETKFKNKNLRKGGDLSKKSGTVWLKKKTKKFENVKEKNFSHTLGCFKAKPKI